MEALGRDTARDLLLLSFTAGSADAIGFLSLGHVFTSNMTGNVVLLGIDLGQGHLGSATRHVYVLAIFVLGVCLGAWRGRNVPDKQWQPLAFRLIGLEKVLLLIFGIAWLLCGHHAHGGIAYALLIPLTLSMGLQSAAMYRMSAPGVATTAVTGTLSALTSGIANHFFVPTPDAEQKKTNVLRVRFQFFALLLYGGGALLSGFLIMHGIHWAGFLPVFAVAFVSLGRSKP